MTFLRFLSLIIHKNVLIDSPATLYTIHLYLLNQNRGGRDLVDFDLLNAAMSEAVVFPLTVFWEDSQPE